MREYGSEHPAVLLPDGYFDTFSAYGYCTWLRSGREALHLVALTEKLDKDATVILIPAYCCNSMVSPFEKAGWKVHYYPLNQDLTVDIECLRKLLIGLTPRAVLTMNFFGSSPTKEVVSCIRENTNRCIVIEDFSHCTFSLDVIYDGRVDYYVSSIRKSVGVCDGAVIVSNRRLDKKYIQYKETDFSKERYNDQLLKGQYAYSKDSTQKEVFYSNLRQQEVELDHFSGVFQISSLGMQMIQSLNGKNIRYARQQNMWHILSILQGKVKLVPGIDRCLNGAPFSLPILVEDRDPVQKKLAEKGVYAPVLWPISSEARLVCPIAARMSDRMLSIPIDQRYDWDDIEGIATIVLETV